MPISNSSRPSFSVIILAAGHGKRAGGERPKQYQQIHGKSVLRHTVDKFLSIPECTKVCVTINSNDANLCHETLSGLNDIAIISGGKERSNSVYNALKSLTDINSEEIILVHDAARPCVRKSDIHALLLSLKENRAATLAAPVTSTLRKADDNHNASEAIARENLWSIQTPQAFRYGDLLNAHENADKNSTYTDDTQLVSTYGIPVKLVEASQENIKITMPEDFKMAEKFLDHSMEYRSGLGFDVHAFDFNKAGPVRLCGIDVEHDHALKGHSDADVGLHALTDAIYSTVCAGDIGIHFPPSDNAFKDMDSSIFLKHAVELIRSKGGEITNADITIICEHPKIGPHAECMRTRIAEICEISKTQINVKATTSEKLGFTGRGEGIAAQALVSIKLPIGALNE